MPNWVGFVDRAVSQSLTNVMPPIASMTRTPWLVKYPTIADVIPTGTPFTVCASFVRWSSFSGLTKLRTTRLTDGEPLPRSINQWLFVSKSVEFRTLPHVHSSLPHSQDPYTSTGVAASALPGKAAPGITSRASVSSTRSDLHICTPHRNPSHRHPPSAHSGLYHLACQGLALRTPDSPSH